MMLAEEGKKQGEGQGGNGGGQGPRAEKEIKTNCPECQALVEQAKAKKAEIEALRGQAKPLHEAEKAKRDAAELAKLEELKAKDPKKYEEVMAKREERKKEMEGKKDERKEGNKGEGLHGKKDGQRGPSPEMIEKMKTENPELYNIMTQVEAKQKEMEALHAQIKSCEETNKGNKK